VSANLPFAPSSASPSSSNLIVKHTVAISIQKYFFTKNNFIFSPQNYHLPGRYFVNLQIWDVGFLSLSTKMVDNYIFGANYV